MRAHDADSSKISARLILLLLVLNLVCVASSKNREPVQAGQGQANAAPDIDHVVSEFTARETEFHSAFVNYGYKCHLIVQTIKDGKVTGEYHRTSQLVLDSGGNPKEEILSFPRPSLTEVTLTPEDLEDLSAKYQFTLETANASKYKFSYTGKEPVDDVDSYVFAVQPKATPSKERLFNGRVWVRMSDLKIIKMRGKGVQKGSQRFPVMESRRIAVGDEYLFPSHAFADEQLKFSNGQSAHLRMEVSYSDYVKLR